MFSAIFGGGTKLTLTHSVKEKKKFGCLKVYKYTMVRSDTNKTHTRIAYRSFPFTFFIVIFFLAILGGMCAVDWVVKDYLY